MPRSQTERVLGVAVGARERDFDCPVCRSNSYVALWQRHFYRCAGCGLGFTDPRMFRRKRPRVG